MRVFEEIPVNGNYWPDYPRIALAELAGLKIDVESAKQFDRRFLPAGLGVFALIVLGFGGGGVLHHWQVIDAAEFAALMIATSILAIGLGVWRQCRMPRVRPINARSGQEMEPFIIGDLETPNHYELAYVDRATGTYFRKVYAELE